MQTIKQIERERLQHKRAMHQAYPDTMRVSFDPVCIEQEKYAQRIIIGNETLQYTTWNSHIGMVVLGWEEAERVERWHLSEHDATDPCCSNIKCYKLETELAALHISCDYIQLWEKCEPEQPRRVGLVSPVLVDKLLETLQIPALPWHSVQRARERFAEWTANINYSYDYWRLTK
jgi:hypothetical protein